MRPKLEWNRRSSRWSETRNAVDTVYVGDLGGLPPTLDSLISQGSQPTFVIHSEDGIGFGYNGPYIPQAGPASVALADAWGTEFDYRSDRAQLTSAGADRRFGTDDDLVHPAAPPITAGNLSVVVTGIPNDGGTACVIGDDEADLYVAISDSGTRREVRLRGPVGSGGPFTTASIHKGIHGLRLEGEDNFAGATSRDVVEILGGNAQLRMTLVQPAGVAPACGV